MGSWGLERGEETIRVTRMVKEGGPVDTLCLPLDVIPGWLFGIQTSRVRDDIWRKLIRYQRECFRVLWDAFKADVRPQLDPALATMQPAADLTPAERALALAEAVYTMARQQVAIESWLVHHDSRLDVVEDEVSAAHERLDTLAPALSRDACGMQAQVQVRQLRWWARPWAGWAPWSCGSLAPTR